MIDLRSTRLKCFMVDGRWRRQGRREYWKELSEAKVRAEQLALERKNNGSAGLNFSIQDRLLVAQCLAKLQLHGRTLDQAVDHYVGWLEGEAARQRSLLVTACVEQYVEARQADFQRGELSKLSLYEITARAKQLSRAFSGTHVAEIGHDQIKTYLDSFPVSLRTKTNIRLRLSKFFNWCRNKGYVQLNPVERIRYRVPESEIQILSVADAVKLLGAAAKYSDVLLYVLLGMFQGLRPGEAEQLTYERIDLGARTIHVQARSSKSRRTRYVDVNETFARWARPLLRKSGPIVEGNFRKRFEEVRRSVGYNPTTNPWPVDLLRHSYGSYWLAVHQDVSRLAHLMGNSEDVIFASYRRVIPRHEAERFWEI